MKTIADVIAKAGHDFTLKSRDITRVEFQGKAVEAWLKEKGNLIIRIKLEDEDSCDGCKLALLDSRKYGYSCVIYQKELSRNWNDKGQLIRIDKCKEDCLR